VSVSGRPARLPFQQLRTDLVWLEPGRQPPEGEHPGGEPVPLQEVGAHGPVLGCGRQLGRGRAVARHDHEGREVLSERQLEYRS
jgi:hypothetical protein